MHTRSEGKEMKVGVAKRWPPLPTPLCRGIGSPAPSHLYQLINQKTIPYLSLRRKARHLTCPTFANEACHATQYSINHFNIIYTNVAFTRTITNTTDRTWKENYEEKHVDEHTYKTKTLKKIYTKQHNEKELKNVKPQRRKLKSTWNSHVSVPTKHDYQ